jgi:hypothetical protein
VRRVPIPPELVWLLREHVESYGTAPEGRLFWTYRGGIYQPSTLWQMLQKARANVFSPAAWPRRWPASRTTSIMLYRIYAHCIDGDDERWHKRMEDFPG